MQDFQFNLKKFFNYDKPLPDKSYTNGFTLFKIIENLTPC